MSKVYFAGDHAFFALKNVLADYVRGLGYEVEDLGPATLDPTDDYPDTVAPCVSRVAQGADSFAIIGGGNGQGEAMVANRTRGVRAAVFYSKDSHDGYEVVRLARQHDNANVLSLGAWFLSEEEAKEAVRIFLTTPFSGEERHQRRLAKF